MFCGDPDHVFRMCPQNSPTGASTTFYRHLFAHKPSLRKRPPAPSEFVTTQPAPQNPAQSFVALPLPPPYFHPPPGSVSLAPPSIAVSAPPSLAAYAPSVAPSLTPAALAPPPLPVITTAIPVPPPTPDSKRPKFFIQIVKSYPTNITSGTTPLPPMPIAIDNGLPHLTFTLGNTLSSPTLCGLMDTCGALNTGYLPFHQWLMSEHPAAVAEYTAFDESNPFEPVKLGGAIRDPDNFDGSTHGNLTAVIRYFTPYTDRSGHPIMFSFALGLDVTVNTIFGLPMLCALDCTISLGSNSLHSTTLNLTLPITRAAARHGLPANCHFDTASFRRNRVAALTGSPDPAHSTFTPATAIATDDLSAGYLQRHVAPILA
jgi:hypothetical protein